VRLGAWFVDTVTVAAVTGKDSYGKPSFGAKTAVKARVQAVRKLVRSSTGNESVSSHVIFTETAINLTDRVWLPGVDSSNDSLAKVPLTINADHDKAGRVTLYEVTLG
jgi:hypothetical protein